MDSILWSFVGHLILLHDTYTYIYIYIHIYICIYIYIYVSCDTPLPGSATSDKGPHGWRSSKLGAVCSCSASGCCAIGRSITVGTGSDCAVVLFGLSANVGFVVRRLLGYGRGWELLLFHSEPSKRRR